MPEVPIVIIGCGRMGGAFARIWSRTNRVLVQDPAVPLPAGTEALVELPEQATILLAVKPQAIAEAAVGLRRKLGPGHIVISIVAGVTTETLRQLLGDAPRIVRAMPNTPVEVGSGMTAAVADQTLSAADRATIELLFAPTGAFMWLDSEAHIDIVTAISGSGPAYFFRFAEALAAAGEAQGLSRDTASELARATLAGAGALAQPGTSLARLREEVTSPAGTTAAALARMEAHGIGSLIAGGVEAAIARAGDLAHEASR